MLYLTMSLAAVNKVNAKFLVLSAVKPGRTFLEFTMFIYSSLK